MFALIAFGAVLVVLAAVLRFALPADVARPLG